MACSKIRVRYIAHVMNKNLSVTMSVLINTVKMVISVRHQVPTYTLIVLPGKKTIVYMD